MKTRLKLALLLVLSIILLFPPNHVSAARYKPFTNGYQLSKLPTAISSGDRFTLTVTPREKNASLAAIEITENSEDDLLLWITYDPKSGKADIQCFSSGETTLEFFSEGYSKWSIALEVSYKTASEPAQKPDSLPVPTASPAPEAAQKETSRLEDQVKLASMMEPISPYETISIEAYMNYLFITDSNRKQALIAYDTVIIPNLSKFIYHMKTLQAPNQELQEIVDLIVKSRKIRLQALNLMRHDIASGKDPRSNKITSQLLEEYMMIDDEFKRKLKRYTKRI